jgi:integrase
MIFIAMLLGLRASEILGLRWEDVDFEAGILHVRRSFVGKFEDDTKTEDSEQELPIHDDLRLVLEAWRDEEDAINGWLFGSIITGDQPRGAKDPDAAFGHQDDAGLWWQDSG